MTNQPKNFDEFITNCVEPSKNGDRVLHGTVSHIVSPGDWPALQKYLAGMDTSDEVSKKIIDRAKLVIANKGVMQSLVGLPDGPTANIIKDFHMAVLEPLADVGYQTRHFTVNNALLNRVRKLGSVYSSAYIDGVESGLPKGNFHSAMGFVAMYGYSGPTIDKLDGFTILDQANDPALADYTQFWQSVFDDPAQSFDIRSA